jgi:hypothetical protein
MDEKTLGRKECPPGTTKIEEKRTTKQKSPTMVVEEETIKRGFDGRC